MTLRSLNVRPPRLALAFVAAPSRLGTLLFALVERSAPVPRLPWASFVCSPPFRSMTLAAVPRAPRTGLPATRAVDEASPGFVAPTLGVPPPFGEPATAAVSRGDVMSGILHPETGYEVHSVSFAWSPRPSSWPESLRTTSEDTRRFPAMPHTLRRLDPRRQPYRLTTASALLPFTTPKNRHASANANTLHSSTSYAEPADLTPLDASGLHDRPTERFIHAASRHFLPPQRDDISSFDPFRSLPASVSAGLSVSRRPPHGDGLRVLPRTLSADTGHLHLSRRLSPPGVWGAHDTVVFEMTGLHQRSHVGPATRADGHAASSQSAPALLSCSLGPRTSPPRASRRARLFPGFRRGGLLPLDRAPRHRRPRPSV